MDLRIKKRIDRDSETSGGESAIYQGGDGFGSIKQTTDKDSGVVVTEFAGSEQGLKSITYNPASEESPYQVEFEPGRENPDLEQQIDLFKSESKPSNSRIDFAPPSPSIDSFNVDFNSLEKPVKLTQLLENTANWSDSAVSTTPTTRKPVFGRVNDALVAVGKEGLLVRDGRIEEPGSDRSLQARP